MDVWNRQLLQVYSCFGVPPLEKTAPKVETHGMIKMVDLLAVPSSWLVLTASTNI